MTAVTSLGEKRVSQTSLPFASGLRAGIQCSASARAEVWRPQVQPVARPESAMLPIWLALVGSDWKRENEGTDSDSPELSDAPHGGPGPMCEPPLYRVSEHSSVALF